MNSREKDVQTLCNAVLSLSTRDTGDSGSGAECPFCYKSCDWRAHTVGGIEHDSDCPVLIAKDLTTKAV